MSLPQQEKDAVAALVKLLGGEVVTACWVGGGEKYYYHAPDGLSVMLAQRDGTVKHKQFLLLEIK